jgi:hypothetical protein
MAPIADVAVQVWDGVEGWPVTVSKMNVPLGIAANEKVDVGAETTTGGGCWVSGPLESITVSDNVRPLPANPVTVPLAA